MGLDTAIDLLFAGMGKLGPGDNVHTLEVLRLLPRQQFRVIVDAGCGTGRQTLVLAKALNTRIHAVDSYEPFLADLAQRARVAGIEPLVETHCMDMKDIASVFPRIDLLWSEGAAYNIGFANALQTWATAIPTGAFAVVSELSWLSDRAPAAVREFFQQGYPDMHSVDDNRRVAEQAGFGMLSTHVLPEDAWVHGYYDVLEPRAKALLDHADTAVREFAAETIREIEIFNVSEQSYGYVFYVLRRN